MSKKKVFKFWKENRNDNEFQMGVKEIETKFVEWMKTKDPDWLDYYCAALVRFFVSEEDGMNSVMKKKDYNNLDDVLYKTKWNFLEKMKVK